MSDAIKKLHDFLAKSPSVVYPEDVLAYLPAIEDENANLREELAILQASDKEKTIEFLRHENIDWEDKYCALAAENAKLRESLERAAGIIADICGECPVSRYEWLSSDGCAEKCGPVAEEECWIAYLTGKRWDESGAEVDR